MNARRLAVRCFSAALFRIPLVEWPRYYLHHPPAWVFGLVGWCLPGKARMTAIRWLDRRPGVCWASLVPWAVWGGAEDGWTELGCSAVRCLKDGAPCYCGKYDDAALAAELGATPPDPMDQVRVVFQGGGEHA